MAYQKNLYRTIIQNRQKALLVLAGEGKDISRIERELALLALDVLDAMQKKALTLREGGKYFVKVMYALKTDTEGRLSGEARDLLNETMIMDEVGTAYGPDLTVVRTLITKILQRDEAESLPQLKKFATALKSEHKGTKMPTAVA